MDTIDIETICGKMVSTLNDSSYKKSSIDIYMRFIHRLKTYCELEATSSYSCDLGQRFIDYCRLNGYCVQNAELLVRKFNNYIDYETFDLSGTDRFKYRLKYFNNDLSKFIDYLKNTEISIKGIEQYENNLRKLLFYFEKNGITDLNQLDFDLICDAYSYSSSSQWFSISAKRFFKFCHIHDITKLNYSSLVPGYKTNKPVPSVYSNDEIKRLMSTFNLDDNDGETEYLIFKLLYELALRESDLINLKISDINADNKTLSFKQVKTKEFTKLPLKDELIALVTDYINNIRPKVQGNVLLINRRTNKPYSGANIYKIISNHFKLADIDISNKRHGPHSLRASKATALINDDIPLPAVATYLGHTSTESTKNYLKVDLKHLRQCALPVPKIRSQMMNELMNINGGQNEIQI